jgi:tetratricopeptide (TPR) repeat protein
MARQLDVDYLVEGSVLRDGDQLRINAQLIRARDDVPLWSGRYDRKQIDVFAIQDEISLGIVNNLRLQLGRGRRRYETSVDAYDHYLRALANSVGHDFDRHDRSIGEFQQAIAEDSSFAPAYAGLGTAYAIRSTQFPAEHPADELVKMRSAAERAIQLDPLLAEAHHSLALTNARDGRWRESEDSFRRAIELDPNHSRTYAHFALWHLLVVGRTQEALQQLRIAEAADPLSSEVKLTIAWVLLSLGTYDEAAVYCGRLPAEEPFRIQCMGRAKLGEGKIAEAVKLFASDPALSRNPQARGFLGHALARSGRHDEAESMAAGSSYANEQALIYAGLGDKDRTFDALERMTTVGTQRMGRYLSFPELAFLRNDSRWQTLRQNVRQF